MSCLELPGILNIVVAISQQALSQAHLINYSLREQVRHAFEGRNLGFAGKTSGIPGPAELRGRVVVRI